MDELSPELTFLLWAVALTFIQLIISLLGATQQHGLTTLAGNRENIGSTSGWAGRAQRAHRNMLENLVLFAILVIVAYIAGCFTAMFALIIGALPQSRPYPLLCGNRRGARAQGH